MKLWIVAFIVSVILVIYAIPTFYDAGIEKRVLKVARVITKDLIETRFLCVSKGSEYSVTFTSLDRPGYTIHNGDKVLKTVFLDQIDRGVVYSSLFNDKGVVLENNTIVFKPVREVNAPVAQGYDSIFLNDRTKESKKDLKSIVRIYINKNSYEVKILKVKKIDSSGDVIFN